MIVNSKKIREIKIAKFVFLLISSRKDKRERRFIGNNANKKKTLLRMPVFSSSHHAKKTITINNETHDKVRI